MLVEDERPSRELFKLLINWENAGFFISCEAADGLEALEKYHIYKPNLVVTDIQMPVMDGLVLIKNIKKENPEQLFIVLSCHELFDYARLALQLGVYDYLIKDSLTAEELLNTLEKAKRLLVSSNTSLAISRHFTHILSYSPRIRKIVEYMLQNFEKDISLNSLAEQFNIHKTHLARIFKEETGASIHEAILDLRMEKAKQLLFDSEMKVSDIIEETGFNSPQNFYVLFKKYTGLSPSEYRSKDLMG